MAQVSLEKINERLNIYKEIRGLGLLIGLELNQAYLGLARKIMEVGFDHRVASLIASSDVTRFTPSLIIPPVDIEEGCKRFCQSLITAVKFDA